MAMAEAAVEEASKMAYRLDDMWQNWIGCSITRQQPGKGKSNVEWVSARVVNRVERSIQVRRSASFIFPSDRTVLIVSRRMKTPNGVSDLAARPAISGDGVWCKMLGMV
ncbi:hypothetical protein PIB30_028597 [Stylosanthes scabra]|uniref:Uncharacterized protein n=1 Tax=Stylosanthes scabra TaxID=79078 RepID=A0ABU6X959_9FABA|nr:hypothetical protein [Stylosanthes scabra]